MCCLNCDCVLIISLYRGRFCVRSAKFSSLYKESRYIEDRYNEVLSHTFYRNFCRTKKIHRYTGNIVISMIVISGFHCICLLLYIIIYADFLNLYHQNRYDKNNRFQDLTFDLRHVIVFLFFYLFGCLSFPNLAILEISSTLLV